MDVKDYPAQEQHYWIDQIAIDQQSLEEKGAQVAIMGEVFRWAGIVFACTGPHADRSEFLFETIDGQDMDALNAFPSLSPCLERRELVRRYLIEKAEPDENFEGPQQIMALFAHKTYWHRLWIMQKLLLSADTTVLCGEKSVSNSNLASFWNAVIFKGVESDSTGWSYTNQAELVEKWPYMRRHSGPSALCFADVVVMFPTLHCADRRDCVYGVRELVAWPSDTLPPQPDYTISALELFWSMVPVLAVKDPVSLYSTWRESDIGMIREVYQLGEEAARAICIPLDACRVLWQALNGSELGSTAFREILLRITGEEYRAVNIPCADLIWDFFNEDPTPSFRDSRRSWEAKRARLVASEGETHLVPLPVSLQIIDAQRQDDGERGADM